MKKSMIFIFAIVAILGFATASLAADMPTIDKDKKPVKAVSAKKIRKAKTAKTAKPAAKPAAQSMPATMPEASTSAAK